MTYITGDKHGSFGGIERFCRVMETKKTDTMIILGDVGFNYYGGGKDARAKAYASRFPIELFCIHGNHENRPQHIASYAEREYHGGKVLFEEAYPNLLFAIDGEVYDFDGYACIVIGGAYSVDKFYRLDHGYNWWADEQPCEEIRAKVEAVLAARGNQIDVVLSHTCPRRYEPVETFLAVVDQSTVDRSTEDWLGKIEARLSYRKWYCGHFHTRKRIDKLQFMFEDFDVLSVR